MRNYRDLHVWSKAHAFSLELYQPSRRFPREEVYGITSQLRRSAVSIGANLAEGCGRRTNAEMAGFARIAMGSASELDHHLLLCRDLGFLHDEDYKRTSRNLVGMRKMLSALLDSIENELGLKVRAAAKG